MTRKYLAFDMETARDFPGSFANWKRHRPLGISCAAGLPSDASRPILWHGKQQDGTPAKQMSAAEAKSVVKQLAQWVAEGYTLLTWNGLGFDFDVLAEESGAWRECQELARGHVDMMFHVFCDRGFPVALDNAAAALDIEGKPAGMSGVLAPRLWAEGQYDRVLDYVAHDVRITMQVAQKCEQSRLFKWRTQKGSVSSMPLSRGWLTVEEAIKLPEPDTSWMTSAIPRKQFTGWLRKDSPC